MRVVHSNTILIQAYLGSSPLVRVKRVIGLIHSIKDGIIPACAGKAYVKELDKLDYEDHPRLCG